MEWFIFAIIVIGVLSGIGKATEANKAKTEAEERRKRAEAAREVILNSGNRELIEKLHLMEATRGAGPGSSVVRTASSSALGTAAAVAGGIIVADAVTTQMHLAALDDAFADIEADLSTDLASVAEDASSIFDVEI